MPCIPTPGAMVMPQRESKPAMDATSLVVAGGRRGHVRKATGWPPNEEMTGPKYVFMRAPTLMLTWPYRWDYARAWHTEHGGMLDNFEEHYSGLDKAVKTVSCTIHCRRATLTPIHQRIRTHYNKVSFMRIFVRIRC